MSSSPTTSTPNLSASSSTVDLSHYDPKVRNLLETGSVKFHIRTAGAKWECTIVDRNTHERRKTLRGDSSSSITTLDSHQASPSAH
ncbi:hypothetical protein QC761_602740 [Podospora bellae-mahoneyi]|uniref:Uncharacterized protein n=1 Tax=Podospora bellae-mahoneyi TaxID=2093777 RepID=A0ABR0FAQ5_9PEZI|nr:hypothetical protein QC761_602740 [Podospora bellae-mahoneyi]